MRFLFVYSDRSEIFNCSTCKSIVIDYAYKNGVNKEINEMRCKYPNQTQVK